MIAIITAMDVELEHILSRLENGQELRRPGLQGYTGTLCGQDVVAAVCGVGKVCAAQCTQLLISEYKPDYILHSGIAGAVGEGLGHLDVVIARELTYRDMKETTKRDFVPFGGYFVADPRLVTALRKSAPESRLGCVATGDLFVNDPVEKERLRRDYNALCAEMEGAAVAHVCAVNRVPFAVIRCISDLANNEAYDDLESFEVRAARKSAQILCSAIALLSEEKR